MYAIIEHGGHQYKVAEGQEIDIDYRGGKAGEEVVFDRVLAVSDETGARFGQPALDGAKVTAEITGTGKGPKLIVQKFKRRKNYRRRTGHRQLFNTVKITKIETP